MNKRVRELLARQSRWQKSRKALSWEQKIKMVEAVREELARSLPAYRANDESGTKNDLPATRRHRRRTKQRGAAGR